MLRRSLLGVGATILANLQHPSTVSNIWHKVSKEYESTSTPLGFDWFTLSLSFLFAIGSIKHDKGLIRLRGVK
jgi:hypothetical protein